MTVNFSKFNRDFFLIGDFPKLDWYNRKGVYNLDEETNVTIELVTNGIAKCYAGYLVTVIHKANGKIDSLYFDFTTYMDMKDRLDNRTDYKGSYHVNESVLSKNEENLWYIAIPENRQIYRMCQQILSYVNEWRR